jgi:hypothetical protein
VILTHVPVHELLHTPTGTPILVIMVSGRAPGYRHADSLSEWSPYSSTADDPARFHR